MTGPSSEDATSFCIMLAAGLPASQAILYFVESDDPAEIALILGTWQRSKAVRQAQSKLMAKPWALMSTDERCQHAMDHHYNTLAYTLLSHHYAEVGPADKGKLDSARQAIESHLAGTAGKGDALSSFWEDLKSGRIKLAAPLARQSAPIEPVDS